LIWKLARSRTIGEANDSENFPNRTHASSSTKVIFIITLYETILIFLDFALSALSPKRCGYHEVSPSRGQFLSWIASSKLFSEVALILVTQATDISDPLSSDEGFLFGNHATRDPIARIPQRIGSPRPFFISTVNVLCALP